MTMPMIINWGSIEAKINDCVENGSGRDKAKKFMDKAKKTGGVTTESGDHIIGAKEMREAVNGMVKIVKSETSGWPGGVAEAASTIGADAPIVANLNAYPSYGQTRIPLSFHTDLSRIGLYDGARNYLLYNVIAAWNNGWHADNVVYGVKSNGKWGWSLSDYPGDGYMQKAINTFNSTYGGKYHCRAKLSPVYDVRTVGNLKQFRKK